MPRPSTLPRRLDQLVARERLLPRGRRGRAPPAAGAVGAHAAEEQQLCACARGSGRPGVPFGPRKYCL
jgi:hypothetical protein